MEQKLTKIFLSTTLVFFIFFTFYNLNWGTPFYFHPDERNIASSVTQLKFPDNLNPHFFAYGSLPIYIVYVLGVATNFITGQVQELVVPFERAIIIGRVLVATLSLLLVFLIYKTTLKFFGKKEALLATFFGLTSVTYLQFSHFGTFEIWLAFLSLLMVYIFALHLKAKRVVYFALGCAIFGILCSLKASSLALGIIPLFIIGIRLQEEKKRLVRIKMAARLLALILVAPTSYFLASPYNILDAGSFLKTLEYEGNVATGSIPVFYTGSFYNTIPVVFQFTRIIPFLINPVLTVVSIPAILFLTLLAAKKRNLYLGLILLSFAALFLSQSYLFAKWTRYIVPSISFLYILISLFLFEVKKYVERRLFNFSIVTIVIVSFLFAASFVKTVRFTPDTRTTARDFAIRNVPASTNILSEVFDLGIVPFNSGFRNIRLFDFYALDSGGKTQLEFSSELETTEYIILPSQRIYKSRTINAARFPIASKFYSDLFSGKLDFEKIYETDCDIFCRITYLGDPVFNIEETANVFDRPTLYIFKRK